MSVKNQLFYNIDEHIDLGTDTKWAEHFIKNNYTEIYKHGFNTIDKFHLWSNVCYFNTTEDDFCLRYRKDHIAFNHIRGISIILNGEGYREHYNFSSSIDKPFVDEFGLTNLENLRLFVLYFKNKLSRNKLVLDEYNKNDEINLKSTNNTTLSILNQDIKLKIKNDFKIDRYYLFDIFNNTYFTKREMDCLLLFAQGLHAKEIAKILKISFRTVEFYFENIKRKFDCKNRTDLMKKLLTSDLFNAILKTQG